MMKLRYPIAFMVFMLVLVVICEIRLASDHRISDDEAIIINNRLTGMESRVQRLIGGSRI